MQELFIYYRAKVDDEAVLRAGVLRLQAHLQLRFPGLRARLLRRPEAVDGMHTWMETYALARPLAPAGITGVMQREIESTAQAALGGWIIGPRHVEVFTCAS